MNLIDYMDSVARLVHEERLSHNRTYACAHGHHADCPGYDSAGPCDCHCHEMEVAA